MACTATVSPAAEREAGSAVQGPFDDLFLLKDNRTRRISSFNPEGANRDYVTVGPGETIALASIEGAGIIRRFYVVQLGADRMRYRKLMLRIYWDGSETPCVEVPLGDFFGAGMGTLRAIDAGPIRVNPGVSALDFDGMVSYLPMPFADGARITIENDGGVESLRLWYQIDFEEIDAAALPANAGRLHACWRREAPTRADKRTRPNSSLGNDDVSNTTGKGNFTILEATGRGTFIGFFLTVDNVAGGWWGEGDDMIFVDGETWPPTYAGTGTEEVFNAGGCPDREFSVADSGFYLIENRGSRWGGKNQMYRFYLNDPVRFRESIRATIEHGHANSFENDYSATAFWYQKDGHREFPKVIAAEDRLPSWPPRVRAAMELETEIRDLAVAIVTDDGEDGAGPELRHRVENALIEGNRSFRRFDDDAYVKAVDVLKELLSAE
jgi:hypothetical protein